MARKALSKNISTQQLGKWAFIGGVLLAIVVGLMPSAFLVNIAGTIPTILVVIGILVGLVNISEKDTHSFLLAAVALLLAGTAGIQNLPILGAYVIAILGNIVAFVAPAAVIVALKAVYELAKK